MVAQTEWTKQVSEPETYPGVLQGYRHFGRPLLFKDMAQLCSVHSKFEYPIIEQEEWWTADCGTTDTVRTSERKHPVVPGSNCRCGFYINYYPENTFYAQEDNLIYPRGVVEASGHLILSTKGFRSQKMRLVALCPIYFGLWKYVEQNFPWVRLYDDPDEMYEAHPQADLTSLIGEEIVQRNLTDHSKKSLWQDLSSQPAQANISAALNYAMSQYGQVGQTLGIPGSLAPGSTLWPLSAVAYLEPKAMYQGSLSDGMRVTVAPGADYMRIERYDRSYKVFDYSQFDNPHYIAPIGNRNYMKDVRVSELKEGVVELDSTRKTMLRLTFIYNGYHYEFNFLTGVAQWRPAFR